LRRKTKNTTIGEKSLVENKLKGQNSFINVMKQLFPDDFKETKREYGKKWSYKTKKNELQNNNVTGEEKVEELTPLTMIVEITEDSE